MRIAIDASRATVARRTGTEAYSLHLIHALIAEGGAHQLLLYFRDSPPPGLIPAVPNVHIEVIARRRLWSHLGLGPAVRRARPDVLFVPSHVIPWPGVGDIPAVVTVHDLGYVRHPEAQPMLRRLYLDGSTRHSVRVARRVIAVSQTTADDLTALYHVPRTKVRVIHSGIDARLKPVDNLPAIVAMRDRYHIPGPYVLHVGTLHSRKNLIALVEAFDQVKDRVEGLLLVLAGQPGWGYDRLVRRIGQLGLQARVMLPGYIEDADLPALYSGARVYVFPSLYEGFGFPALEAMACGTPVVCTNASSLPELVGDAALTFPPDDRHALAEAISRVLTDETLQAGLVGRGFEQVQKFSCRTCARKTLEVLAEASASSHDPTINGG
jgi:glycosyltransferase involved in cell wall biosynthesis